MELVRVHGRVRDCVLIRMGWVLQVESTRGQGDVGGSRAWPRRDKGTGNHESP